MLHALQLCLHSKCKQLNNLLVAQRDTEKKVEGKGEFVPELN